MQEFDDSLGDTTKRDKGTAFHAAMDRYFRESEASGDKWLKPVAHDPEVTGWARLAVEWVRKHLEPRCELIESEVYVGSNFGTGEVHVDPSVLNRKYPEKPGFVPGTTDLVCVLLDGSLLVADWKTGGATGADKQLLTLAVGLRKVYQKPDGSTRPVRLAILYAGPDGVLPNEWEVSESELVAHADAMAFQLADVGVRTDPVPGVHCTQYYCKHLAYCPGITSIVGDASGPPQVLLSPQKLVKRKAFAMSAKPTSPEHAGYIMERVTAAKRQLGYYEDGVRKYANDGGKVIAGDFEFSKKADGFRWRKQ